MKNKLKEKKIDAVKMMREIRDKLSERYLNNPESEEMDLREIRKKYGIKLKNKENIL